MTIPVTGGTGNVGGAVARLLQAVNYPLIIASRMGVAGPFKAVKFDWVDPSTFENPFNADPNIDHVFVIAPISGDACDIFTMYFLPNPDRSPYTKFEMSAPLILGAACTTWRRTIWAIPRF
ncbi:hypothetical protein NLJ89_g8977 [Agrocybe chaxingu]|uniref:NAD-dependent epimerase/dehydratase domain-containing protein n=1 Tax=Agrocybe chaxingu TaxID=84603 RepID=A0A9W8K1G8_9AGAR|nr:hypothetical protein NLJ89_g8977 [Agrocybe chaxingu]